MSNRYQSDRQALVEGFTSMFGRSPTLNEAQIIQAIGEHETNWGRGWSGEGVGSNNVGAIQTSDSSQGFPHGDSHEDGTPYTTYFRIYPTLVDGAKDLINQVTNRRPQTWAAIASGDYTGTAWRMHEKDAQSGVGVYHETPPNSYASAIYKAGQVIAQNVGEPLAHITSFSILQYLLPAGIGAIGFYYFTTLKKGHYGHYKSSR